jgi:hypothetical protein
MLQIWDNGHAINLRLTYGILLGDYILTERI